VICPDDPTIVLRAKGRLDRNLMCELDAVGQAKRPDYLRGELKRADYVITVKGIWTPLINSKELAKLGFKPVADPVFYRSAYTLFHRASPAAK
jgi:hypothetical protein